MPCSVPYALIKSLSKYVVESVPDAACSMMRDSFFAFCFHLFHRVVKKEVNQNSIDVGIGMCLLDLPPYQLNTPNTTSCNNVNKRYPTIRMKSDFYLVVGSPTCFRFQ